MIDKDVEIGKTYFFNNREVLIIRQETDGVYFAVATEELEIEVHGWQWCEACMVGGTDYRGSHRCEEYDEVIEEILEQIGDRKICPIFVIASYLREEPFEYQEYKALKNEIVKLQSARDFLANQKKKLDTDNMLLSQTVSRKQGEIAELLEEIDNYKDDIVGLKMEKAREFVREFNKKGVLSTIKDVQVGASKIPTNVILNLIKSDIRMSCYDAAKVDKTDAGGYASDIYDEQYGERDIDEVAMDVLLEMIESNK